MLYVQITEYQNILRCWTLAFTHIKVDLSSLPYFLHDFWRKIFLILYPINWLNSFVWLPLLLEILGNMYIVIICFPVSDIKFEINLNFLIKPFTYMTKKLRPKIKISQERKELLRWNKKHVSSFLKGFQWLNNDWWSVKTGEKLKNWWKGFEIYRKKSDRKRNKMFWWKKQHEANPWIVCQFSTFPIFCVLFCLQNGLELLLMSICVWRW